MEETAEIILIENREIGVDEMVDSYLASKIVGLAPRTIRDMGTKRILTVYKVGARANRFLVSDLLAYTESRRCEAVR